MITADASTRENLRELLKAADAEVERAQRGQQRAEALALKYGVEPNELRNETGQANGALVSQPQP